MRNGSLDVGRLKRVALRVNLGCGAAAPGDALKR
jgi:hypothetical protein